MCMGKNNDTEETMKIFQKLRKLVDKQCLHICSM